GGPGVVILAVPVRAPFPHVAVHVVQPERVLLACAHWGREAPGIPRGNHHLLHVGERRPPVHVGHPSHVRQRVRVVAVVVAGGGSRAAAVLPFGFGGQAVTLP